MKNVVRFYLFYHFEIYISHSKLLVQFQSLLGFFVHQKKTTLFLILLKPIFISNKARSKTTKYDSKWWRSWAVRQNWDVVKLWSLRGFVSGCINILIIFLFYVTLIHSLFLQILVTNFNLFEFFLWRLVHSKTFCEIYFWRSNTLARLIWLHLCTSHFLKVW